MYEWVWVSGYVDEWVKKRVSEQGRAHTPARSLVKARDIIFASKYAEGFASDEGMHPGGYEGGGLREEPVQKLAVGA